MTFANRLSCTASYDQMGRATSVTKDLSGVTNPLEGTNTYRFDDAGRLDSWELNDGTTTTSTAYDWDPDSNRIRQTSGTDPRVTSTFDDAQGLGQTAEFLATGRTIDPDGPGRVWEVPIRAVDLLRTLGF